MMRVAIIFSLCIILCLLLLTTMTIPVAVVQAYVVGGDHHHQQHHRGGNSNNDILSRFDFQCKILMTVGRTPNTEMPPEWAASGAKLTLPLHVQFSTMNKECISYDELNQESLLLGDSLGVAKATTMSSSSSSCSTVMPMNEPSFISTKGQEIVKVTPGVFSCQIQIPDTEQYSFRFFLDFPEGATRNDVVLPAGRIFFMTACWNNEDTNWIERAKRVKKHHVASLRKINVELAEIQNMIGLQTTSKSLMKTSRYFNLLEHRNKLLSQINMLEEAFPPEDRLVKGPNDIVFLREGVIAVKRTKDRKEKYHWVGTFTLGEFKTL
ncbi:hypothetical protein ACHAXH_000129 [Discostella pseudostelligera]